MILQALRKYPDVTDFSKQSIRIGGVDQREGESKNY